MLAPATTNADTFQRRIAEHIGARAFKHLQNADVLFDAASADIPALEVWACPDRVVLMLDPLQVKRMALIVSQRFLHDLTAVLQGRCVVRMNHHGIFFQVSYAPEPARELLSKSLDLSRQPSPLHVPIGATLRDDMWLSLVEMDAILIGGARRMGKTNLLHSWIAALLQGGETRLILFDGKAGVEFARYANQPRVQVVEKLSAALGELFAEMNTRLDVLRAARVANLADYNRDKNSGGRLERIVLIVDELAFALHEPGVEDVIVDVIARGGAVGIHPILATQRPSSDIVTPRLKSNLVTRIALPVPDRASSMVILDRAGAESIAKMPGRLLIAHNARHIEAQAFTQVESENVKVKSDTPMLASSKLSERETRLARAVVEQLDGWFITKRVLAASGERDVGFVSQVAQRWELLGYLTPVLKNERGHNLGRRATARLPQLLARESGESANEANQDESGESGANVGLSAENVACAERKD